MRKTVLFITLVTILASCSERENEWYDVANTGIQSNKTVLTEQEEILLSAATKASSLLATNVTLKDASQVTRSVSRNTPIQYITRISHARKSHLVADTLLYIVNYENDGGYAVMIKDANSGFIPVAVIEYGSYDPDLIERIPGLQDFMNKAEAYATEKLLETVEPIIVQGDDLDHIPPFDPDMRWLFYQDDTVRTVNISPKIDVMWGQDDIYGSECPNGICGCSNTALAQALTYYQYPASIALTYANAPTNTQTLDWSDINLHIHKYNTTASQSAKDAIGRLCRQLGELSGSDYSSQGSTPTPAFGTWNTVGTLGLDKTQIANMSSSIPYFTLDGNEIILMWGFEIDGSGDTVGHMWVVDGTYGWSVRHRIWSVGLNDAQLIDDVTEHCYYNHVNWG